MLVVKCLLILCFRGFHETVELFFFIFIAKSDLGVSGGSSVVDIVAGFLQGSRVTRSQSKCFVGRGRRRMSKKVFLSGILLASRFARSNVWVACLCCW